MIITSHIFHIYVGIIYKRFLKSIYLYELAKLQNYQLVSLDNPIYTILCKVEIEPFTGAKSIRPLAQSLNSQFHNT